MADDARVIQGIDWRRTFPFTHIFRSFRIAIHPSKLLLALLGLVLLYVGGRVLDGIWPQSHQARYVDMGANGRFDEIRAYENTYTPDQYEDALHNVSNRRGLFLTFFDYEIAQLDGVVKGVRDGRWVGSGASRDNLITGDMPAGMSDWPQEMKDEHYARARAMIAGQGSGLNGRGDSVVQSIRNFVVTGPAWAFTHHPIYFTIFGLWFLLIWSIFGGAIARIAAIHVARDEKLSIRQALRFSVGKLLSFLFAPVIPMVIVLVVGAVVAIVALLGNVPYIGPIVIGVFFFLALAAGFVMTLVMLGTIGGFNLMYPTIAVEGSDSFDAISRSFSYLYARPWRMAFYSLIGIVYGALCYLFVRLFIWLMLALTHFFVDIGMFAHADNSSRELFNTMWISPVAAGRLVYNVDWSALNWGERVGAGLICFWVYLVIAMLGAFAISFYFSANTVIYYLMRQEVDATELDDVYVEQSEEDFGDTAIPSSAPTAAATVTVASVETTSAPESSTTSPSSSDSSSPPATT